MKIYNATIKKVAVGLYGLNKRLSVKLDFSSSENLWSHTFDLTDWTAVSQLTILMNFAKTEDLKELEGKEIRVVIYNGMFRGFGHPENDKFITVSYFAGRYPMSVSEKEFGEMLNKHLDYWY